MEKEDGRATARDMVERVARAICKDRFLGPEDEDGWNDCTEMLKEDYRGNARAAIEAMREPTVAMLHEGGHADIYGDGCSDIRQVWALMIDAALTGQ